MTTGVLNTTSFHTPEGVRIIAPASENATRILSTEALRFVAQLEREFGDRRRELLKRRLDRQQEINSGKMPDFLAPTSHIRQGYWRVLPPPADLLDRRVELTGPPTRKMIINGLNSGAKVFMADFEDANSPTWTNIIDGQLNLSEAVSGTLGFTNEEGKQYRLNDRVATLMVRPRGWHLEDKHIIVDGHPISASLLDFGLYFFHNARRLTERGTGPYFYLPKLENHLEAMLWNDVFLMAEDEFSLPRSSIRATVLIENILAAFEMHEILYALREHSAGLNCGRWDYIFSFIKKFRHHLDFVLPDRSRITMASHFLHSYSLLLIQTCHKRGTHAMGGMAAFIPIKDDARANEEALARVRADKEREVEDGHDGTWVAHPALVPLATSVFDGYMPGPNQFHRKREDVEISAADLLRNPKGEITEQGFRTNIDVAIQYIESWLGGVGCVPIYNLMEDTATAEISRAQLWQWVHHPNLLLADKQRVTKDFFRRILHDELNKMQARVGQERWLNGRYGLATS
ncbi:MAG TPA: malate synthase A, partial [Bacteroidota bacterium]